MQEEYDNIKMSITAPELRQHQDVEETTRNIPAMLDTESNTSTKSKNVNMFDQSG